MKSPLPPRRSHTLPATLSALLCLFMLNAGHMVAADQTWLVAGAKSSWQNGANWAVGIPPTAGDALIFTGSTRTANTNDFPVGTPLEGSRSVARRAHLYSGATRSSSTAILAITSHC